MKKIFICCLCFFLIVSCADSKIINGVKYDSYGLLNEDSKKNPNIQYELSMGNIIWSIILIETIVMPVYFIGFSVYEPIGLKENFKPGILEKYD